MGVWNHTWLRRIALGATLASLASLAACEPIAEDDDFDRQAAPIFRRSGALVPAPPRPTTLRVMAWNIKFGAARIDFWFDYWGDRVQMTHAEVTTNLDGILALIHQVRPDVLLTEEVDVNSRRSAYVDMVQRILDGSDDLNYAAFVKMWDSRYIPSEGLGRMESGMAIFTRHPIRLAERIRQTQRTDLPAIEDPFNPKRMIGRAVLDLGGREVAAYVVHTEAYDKDGTKQRQFVQIRDELARESRPFFVGGDFNELPPTAVKLVHFPDEHPRSLGTDFEQPPYTPQAMQQFYDALVPAIPLAEYGTTEDSQRRYYSHTVLGPELTNAQGEHGFWNRTLDFLFASRGSSWVTGRSDVLQSPGRQGITVDPNTLSDHAPVVGDWVLPP